MIESPFYFDDRNGIFTAGAFLHDDETESFDLALNPAQRETKEAVFAAFQTQSDLLGLFEPCMRVERFRVAPAYDFLLPPSPWPAYYQRFIPDLSPARFCEFAVAAIAELEPAGVAA